MKKNTEKARITLPMGTSILVVGSTTRKQVKAFLLGLLVTDMRDNSRMARRTEKARITLPMGTST